MIELRPSSAYIWTKCLGQPHVAKNHKHYGEETDAAREGTCAAWVAEMVLTGQVSNASELLNHQCPNGLWEVDDEMVYYVSKYVSIFNTEQSELHVEKSVTFTDFCKGTPDAHACTSEGKLQVIDLKYGYSIVEPYLNPQLGIYAAAIEAESKTPITSISLAIYQPRAVHALGPYRIWEPTPEEWTKFKTFLYKKASDAVYGDNKTTPGEHCKYCNVSGICDSARRFTYDAYESYPVIKELNTQELANELDFIDRASTLIESRKKSLHAEAQGRIKHNSEHIPGWKIERRPGHRRFSDKYSPKELTAFLGVPITEERVITPAKAERLGADPEVLKKFTEQPLTAARIMKDDPSSTYALFTQKKGE